MNYYDRPEWSYSSMKKILDSGIDYAVAAKQGLIPGPVGKAIDLGTLIHMLVLGGDDNFAICEFDNYLTKAAREWRDEQLATGKNIVTKSMWAEAAQILNNIENHPHSEEYLTGKGIKHEQEMFARTGDGVALKGKADAIKLNDNSAIVTDLKTTAQFDKFAKSAYWMHYDLQSVVYSLIAASHLKIDPAVVNYMFCVAETVKPYRVQYFHASLEFIESGERKMRTCIDEIVKFGDRKPTFMIEEIKELGDYSL